MNFPGEGGILMHFAKFRILKMTGVSQYDKIKSKEGILMKRIRNSIVFALCLILTLAPVASANSGPTEWTGTNLTGVSFTGEQCPLVVLEEKLTFDISELPLAYWEYRENP